MARSLNSYDTRTPLKTGLETEVNRNTSDVTQRVFNTTECHRFQVFLHPCKPSISILRLSTAAPTIPLTPEEKQSLILYSQLQMLFDEAKNHIATEAEKGVKQCYPKNSPPHRLGKNRH